MNENTDELVIDSSNFDQYFFDVRKHKAKPGQVMAKYTAVAYFEDGQLKRDVIDLLFQEGKANSAARIMETMGCTTSYESIRVCREMATDLVDGFSVDEVAFKPYRFTFEQLFWADKRVVPANDPHWYTIPVLTWGNSISDDWGSAITELEEAPEDDFSS